MNKQLAQILAKYRMRYPERLAADFPHVENAIMLMWGSQDLYRYFDKLFLIERTNREGFPPDVIQEIMSLRALHEKLFPERQTDSVWSLAFQK